MVQDRRTEHAVLRTRKILPTGRNTGQSRTKPRESHENKAFLYLCSFIGEISIAPAGGRDSGILDAQGADEGQPQELQQSGPKGKRDDCPRSLRSVFMGGWGVSRGGRQGHTSKPSRAARRGPGRFPDIQLWDASGAPPCAGGADASRNHLAAFNAAIFSPINQSALLSLMS